MEFVVKNIHCEVHNYLFLIWQLLKPLTFITNDHTKECVKICASNKISHMILMTMCDK